MPVLELVAMHFGVQSLLELFGELQSAVRSINIRSLKLFTDSTISLAWVEALLTRFEKMSGKSIFAMNRLEAIKKLCQTHPVEFYHVLGAINPVTGQHLRFQVRFWPKHVSIVGLLFYERVSSFIRFWYQVQLKWLIMIVNQR